jgi:hypothetical protein
VGPGDGAKRLDVAATALTMCATVEHLVQLNLCYAPPFSTAIDALCQAAQVVENKIYYVRQQPDASKNRQIWTMEMNIDGTGWKEVRRTDTPFDKQFPQLQVFEYKTYYTWNESDGRYRQIWTAEMNLDGPEGNEKTTPSKNLSLVSGGKREDPSVWRESDGSHFQI